MTGVAAGAKPGFGAKAPAGFEWRTNSQNSHLKVSCVECPHVEKSTISRSNLDNGKRCLSRLSDSLAWHYPAGFVFGFDHEPGTMRATLLHAERAARRYRWLIALSADAFPVHLAITNSIEVRNCGRILFAHFKTQTKDSIP